MKTKIYKNIVADDEVCSGRPTIEGTRITLKPIIGHLLEGDSEDVILKGFSTSYQKRFKHYKRIRKRAIRSKIFCKNIILIRRNEISD
jgi:uncharacterized protein (DUF433 family)